MTRTETDACPGGEEAHDAHMDANGECPWCGELLPQCGWGVGGDPVNGCDEIATMTFEATPLCDLHWNAFQALTQGASE
jgi:hypothetical protein